MDETPKARQGRRAAWITAASVFVSLIVAGAVFLGPGLLEARAMRILDAAGAYVWREPRGPEWLVDLAGEWYGEWLPRATRVRLIRLELDRRLTFHEREWAALGRLRGLYTLDLAYTNVTDADLKHLKGLTNLQQLSLHGAPVTDAGLEHLNGLTKLERLEIHGTAVTDSGLEHIGSFTQLKYLNLDFTAVTDAGLEHLKGLTQLEHLFLYGTSVTDAGVVELKKALPDLKIHR